MADTANLRIRVDSNQVSEADRRLRQLNRTARESDVATSRMSNAFAGLQRRVAGLVAAYVGFQTVVATVNRTLTSTKEYEILRAQLKTATGSAEEATNAFERLQVFAQTTPFIMNEVVESFVKLTNLGLDPSIAALTSYGNTASAMGKSLDQLIEAVADAATGEFERLKEFGIKASKEGDNVTFRFRGVATTVRNSSEEIQQYLRNLGDFEFAGAMADQSDTLNVAFSNLEAATDRLLVKMGEESGFVKIVKDATNALSDLFNEMAGAPRDADVLTIAIAQLEERLENASGQAIPSLRRELRELREELGRSISAQEGPEAFEAALARLQTKIQETRDRIAQAAEQTTPQYGTKTRGAKQPEFIDVDAEQEALNALLDAEQRLLAELEVLRAEAAAKREQQAKEAADRRVQLAQEETDKIAAKEAEQSAKAYDRLQTVLLSEEERIRHSYEERLRIIRENTAEGSEERARMEELARQRMVEELDRSLDVTAFGEDRRKQLLNDKYQSQQELLRSFLELKLITEQEFQERSRANYDAYAAQIADIDNKLLTNQATTQLQLYSQVLTMAGAISGQLLSLAEENSDLAKASFVAQKAIAIAQAVINTELAATRALAEGGFFAGIPMATAIRALGYTSVGLMVAQSAAEYAGRFETGGMIGSGQFGLVGEAGPEIVRGPAMVTSARQTKSKMAGQTVEDMNVPQQIFNVDLRGASVDAVQRLETFVRELNNSIEGRALAVTQDMYSRNPAYLRR